VVDFAEKLARSATQQPTYGGGESFLGQTQSKFSSGIRMISEAADSDANDGDIEEGILRIIDSLGEFAGEPVGGPVMFYRLGRAPFKPPRGLREPTSTRFAPVQQKTAPVPTSRRLQRPRKR